MPRLMEREDPYIVEDTINYTCKRLGITPAELSRRLGRSKEYICALKKRHWQISKDNFNDLLYQLIWLDEENTCRK